MYSSGFWHDSDEPITAGLDMTVHWGEAVMPTFDFALKRRE
jgi:hypothetical protein